MKKFILLFAILYCQLSFSQTQASDKKIKFKNVKIGAACAGTFLIAGSVINVVKTYQSTPDKRRDFGRVSSMCYGLSGFSLVTICFNF